MPTAGLTYVLHDSARRPLEKGRGHVAVGLRTLAGAAGRKDRTARGRRLGLAEKQLVDGTASPSVLTHYLKLATTRESVERDILEKQAKLIAAKTDAIGQNKDTEELVKNAIAAMRHYSGTD